MTYESRIRQLLQMLYGEDQARETWKELSHILREFSRQKTGFPAQEAPLSEKDALLITYGDTFHMPGVPPLRTLAAFIDKHLQNAITGIHILPFFPYSSDDGFSVIDYRAVDPKLGSWADITALGEGYRLMFDGVINHVSSQSAWFQAYLRDEPPYRDYFITADPDWDLSSVVRPRTLPLLTQVQTAAGPRSVWTTFSADQIDLNYANPQVLLEMISLLLFYVERGMDILRLDAIAYLWKEPGTACIHLYQTHAVIKIIRLVFDAVAPHVMLISETNVPHEDNISYFGDLIPGTNRTDEAQLVYQFPLAPLILHTLATGDASRLSQWAATLESKGLFFNFIASHDGIGVTPARGLLTESQIQALVERCLAHGGRVSYKSNPDGTQIPYELNITLYDALNDPSRPDAELDFARFMASQVIMLSLAGVPGIYIHSLFGSRNCQGCVEKTGQARSINREKFDYRQLDARLAQPESREGRILNEYRRLLTIRRKQPAFHPFATQRVVTIAPEAFSIVRTSLDGGQTILSLVNASGSARGIRLDTRTLEIPSSQGWLDLLSGTSYPPDVTWFEIDLRPYQPCWLTPRQQF